MSTTHNTKYPVWSECMEHPEPDGVDDERYECIGQSACVAFTLADWSAISDDEQISLGYVLCQQCTTFHAEQEAWEATHEHGSGLDWSGVICKTRPPRHYCLECSEANEDGEWIQHEDSEEATR